MEFMLKNLLIEIFKIFFGIQRFYGASDLVRTLLSLKLSINPDTSDLTQTSVFAFLFLKHNIFSMYNIITHQLNKNLQFFMINISISYNFAFNVDFANCQFEVSPGAWILAVWVIISLVLLRKIVSQFVDIKITLKNRCFEVDIFWNFTDVISHVHGESICNLNRLELFSWSTVQWKHTFFSNKIWRF